MFVNLYVDIYVYNYYIQEYSINQELQLSYFSDIIRFYGTSTVL